MQAYQLDELKQKAQYLRELMIDVTYKTGGAYLAQSLSVIDMMTALFYRYMQFKPDQPKWPDRDRFLMSPGHYALPLYTILADLEYFPQSLLYTFKDNGSPLELATHKDTVPGVEVSGGSLGQVLSVGIGMALYAKQHQKSYKVFVCMSDGEQDEGQIWEAAAAAAHFRLNNLIAVIDKNGFQVDGATQEVMNMEPLLDKYRAFGWQAIDADGNDMETIVQHLDSFVTTPDRPSIFIGTTLRGKGISFMEGNPAYHYTRLDASLENQAKSELQAGWDAV